MQVIAQRERDLESPADGVDAQIAHRPAAVRERQGVRGRAGPLDGERIGGDCVERPVGPNEHIGESGTGGLDRGLSGTAFVRVGEDAVLRRRESGDRRGREGEREHRENEGLSPITRHGVHSIRRAACPRTTSGGRPMNDSGAATA